MGCDIHLRLQVRKGGSWETVEDDRSLDLDRDYDTFGLLFGVRNYCHFKPVAAKRGLPADFEADWEGELFDTHSHTCLTPGDVRSIDWGQEGLELDDRIRVETLEGEAWVCTSKYSWSNDPQDESVRRGEVVYDSPTMRKRLARAVAGDAHNASFQRLFDRVLSLAEQHGDDNVRAVVWFDN